MNHKIVAANSMLFGALYYSVSGFVHPTYEVLPCTNRPNSLFRSTAENEETTDNDTKTKAPSWLRSLLRKDSSVRNDVEIDGSDEKIFDSFPFSIGGRDKKSKIWDQEMSPVVASLSGMINIEALMAAANITTTNITSNNGSDDIESVFQEMLPSIEVDSKTGLSSVDTSVITDALSFLDGSMRWEKFMQQAQKKNETPEEIDMLKTVNMDMESNLEGSKSSDVDKILSEATKRLEFAVNSVSSTLSPTAIQGLVVQASKTLALREASGNLTLAAKMVFDEASKAPRATAKYTAELIEFANITLAQGMITLFKNYASVKTVPRTEWRQAINKAAEYGALSGAIYENTLPNTHDLGHTIVAQGKTSDIAWMITDSIQQSQDFFSDAKDEPIMVRSLILRGFDASDEEVDREGLLNAICRANPVPFGNSTVLVHEGMLQMAEKLYNELECYIDFTAPIHKFVFAGHSIGGSLSILLMAILSQRRSASFVRERLLRVFSYGSPPTFSVQEEQVSEYAGVCAILDALDISPDLVYGYSQPWDPIPRLFTQYDPLYPLIDDLGEDGVTPYVSGPSRTLRPITKALLEAWEGWPRFRDNARVNLGQNYRSVGKQFLLLPDPARYLTDRLVSVNIPVPSINNILQISSEELLSALNEVFLIDTFSISTVPVAIRSFIHHFYPAYLDPFLEYAYKSDPAKETFTKEEYKDP